MTPRTLLPLAASVVLAACTHPPREAMYANIEAGKNSEAVRLGDEFMRKNPDSAGEIVGALRVAKRLDAIDRARTSGSFSDWSSYVAGDSSSLLGRDEALFMIGKRVHAAEFWQAWLSAFPQSPLRREAQVELASCQLRNVLSSDAGTRRRQYQDYVRQNPDSPYRAELDVLFFGEYLELLRTTNDPRELERFLREFPDSAMAPEISKRLDGMQNLQVRTENVPGGTKRFLKNGHVLLELRAGSSVDRAETNGDGGSLIRFSPGAFGAVFNVSSSSLVEANGTFYEPAPNGGCALGDIVAGTRSGAWIVWSKGACPDSVVRRDSADDLVLYGSMGRAVREPEDVVAVFPVRLAGRAFATDTGTSRVASIALQRNLLQVLFSRSPAFERSVPGRTTRDMLRLVEKAKAPDLQSVYEAECRAKNELACTLSSHPKVHAAAAQGEAWATLYAAEVRAGCDAGEERYCLLSRDFDRMRTTPPKAQAQIAK